MKEYLLRIVERLDITLISHDDNVRVPDAAASSSTCWDGKFVDKNDNTRDFFAGSKMFL